MDIDLLKTFVAICDTKSFTSAGRQVGRTQSAVSLQMRRLEESLGRPLFFRDAAGTRLTEHGEILLTHARRLLDAYAETLAAFDRHSTEGHVVLGVPEDYAPRLLPPVLAAVRELYPDATSNLVLHQSSTLVKGLADGAVDLAFITEGDVPHRGGPVVFRDRFVWVAARNTDVHQRDPLPIAVWDEGDGYSKTMIDALDKIDRRYRITVVCQSMTGLRTVLATGSAVSAIVTSSLENGLRTLGPQDGFPPLAELSIRLERSHVKKSPVIDRLESHLVKRLTAGG